MPKLTTYNESFHLLDYGSLSPSLKTKIKA